MSDEDLSFNELLLPGKWEKFLKGKTPAQVLKYLMFNLAAMMRGAADDLDDSASSMPLQSGDARLGKEKMGVDHAFSQVLQRYKLIEQAYQEMVMRACADCLIRLRNLEKLTALPNHLTSLKTLETRKALKGKESYLSQCLKCSSIWVETNATGEWKLIPTSGPAASRLLVMRAENKSDVREHEPSHPTKRSREGENSP